MPTAAGYTAADREAIPASGRVSASDEVEVRSEDFEPSMPRNTTNFRRGSYRLCLRTTALFALTNFTPRCSRLQMAFASGVQRMTTVPKDGFRPLPHLVALGATGAAIVGVFFGVAFLLISPPHPTAPSADPGPHAQAFEAYEVAPDPGLQAQALEAQEVAPPPNNATTSGTSSAPHAEKTAASPISRTASNGETSALGSTAMETQLTPLARITHPKRVRIVRYHRQSNGKPWGALWRPDAHAGPNPGGGFYGPPNINVGYIDPR